MSSITVRPVSIHYLDLVDVTTQEHTWDYDIWMHVCTDTVRERERRERRTRREESEEWQDLVMERSKSLLIQMATPDALIRLQCTQLAEEERRKITTAYTEQHHGSISDFVCHHLQRQFGGVDEEGGLLLHVSTKTRSSTLCHLIFFSPGNHTQSLAVLH